jgi:hypothetical protein
MLQEYPTMSMVTLIKVNSFFCWACPGLVKDAFCSCEGGVVLLALKPNLACLFVMGSTPYRTLHNIFQ